jgi:tripartite-type tricarboxylate transporter receptor subunit TctC
VASARRSINSLHACVAAALLAVTPSLASAQEFPSKPLRFIVPYPPSGAVDVLARTLAPPMSRTLGQNFIVENRPGGNTVIAAELVMRAPADGHTVLLMAPSFTINPFVRSKLSYDVLRDFAPVARLVVSPLVIAAHPSLPMRNVKELVAFARTRPGQLTYGTSSVIGGQRIAMELFKELTRIDVVNVPYNGGALATMAAVGGHTTMLVTNVIEAAEQVKSGKLRGLAVTTIQRSEVLPEVPTVAESGYPGFDAGNWFGAVVRAGAPRAAIERLNLEMTRALDQPEVREVFVRQGLMPAATTPAGFDAFLRAEMERNGRIVKKLNLKID